MKKYVKWILVLNIILIVVLGSLIFYISKEGEYYFTGAFIYEPTNIKVDVLIMQNKNGSLLTYNTNIYHTEENIVSGRLYYLKENNKEIILGNNLNMYDYYSVGKYENEYGCNNLDNILNNKNDLYFDLCKNFECNDIFKTIKLKLSKLN